MAGDEDEDLDMDMDMYIPDVTPDGKIYYFHAKTGHRSWSISGMDDASSSSRNPFPLPSPNRSPPRPPVSDVEQPSTSPQVADSRIHGGSQSRSPGHSTSLSESFRESLRFGRNRASSSFSSRALPIVGALSEAFASTSSTRLSVYSDSSDVQPRELFADRNTPGSHSSSRSAEDGLEYRGGPPSAKSVAYMLKEKLRVSPQQTHGVGFTPARARESIAHVLYCFNDDGTLRQPRAEVDLAALVDAVVRNIRGLIRNVDFATSQRVETPVVQSPTSPRSRQVFHEQSVSPPAQPRPSQGRVITCLSDLVLAMRAVRQASHRSSSGALANLQDSASELDRAVASYISHWESVRERTGVDLDGECDPVHATFIPGDELGPGIVGAGSAAEWKGFGFVRSRDGRPLPQHALTPSVVSDLKLHKGAVEDGSEELLNSIARQEEYADVYADSIILNGRRVLTRLDAYLRLISDINVAKHVQVDGLADTHEELHTEAIERARVSVRQLETSVQALYDDAGVMLSTIQSATAKTLIDPCTATPFVDSLSVTVSSIRANITQAHEIIFELTENALVQSGFTPSRDSVKTDRPVPSTTRGRNKVDQILGETPAGTNERYQADAMSWYLRSKFSTSEIILEPDGSIRGGTPAALVDRLTNNVRRDITFNETFFLTYKSFMRADELFGLLVEQYHESPPIGLTPPQVDEWIAKKQAPTRICVLIAFKTMISDDGILDKNDAHILDRIKDFVQSLDSDARNNTIGRGLLNLIEGEQSGQPSTIRTTRIRTPSNPPPAKVPRSSSNLQLLDIDAQELARQLTILVSRQFREIKLAEFLLRTKEKSPGDSSRHISAMIETSNSVSHWVAASILEKEDPRGRANVIKQFITVAERCASMNNFATVMAIISGLNSASVSRSRLKKTWEQVNTRTIAVLQSCQNLMDFGKSFANYKDALSKRNPPCVPFIGVYLTTLQFIEDGSKDTIGGGLVNFAKRTRMADVIREINIWQSKPYNLTPLSPVLVFLERSFGALPSDIQERLWTLSLEREPRERGEEDRMTRMFRDNGLF